MKEKQWASATLDSGNDPGAEEMRTQSDTIANNIILGTMKIK